MYIIIYLYNRRISMGKERYYDGGFLSVKANLSNLSGNSVRKGNMTIAKKKAGLEDDTAKRKYQTIHFIKKVIGELENPAVVEVATMEFLRLMIPRQPKTRIVYNNESKESQYVRSKGILNSSHLPRWLNAAKYGTAKGYKGAGELFIFSLQVLNDADHRGHNLLVDKDGWLFRIDGGRTVWKNKYAYPSALVTVCHKALLNNSVYLHEMQKSVLKVLVMSDALINTFMSNFEENKNIPSYDGIKFDDDYLIGVREKFHKKFTEENIDDWVPGFKKYYSSEQAKTDLEEHQQHVKKFLSKQNREISPDTIEGIAEEIDTLYKGLKDYVSKEIKDTPEVLPIVQNARSSSTMNISMMVLSGFIATVGIAAVAVSFTMLNAATLGIPGLVIAGLGIAATLSGIGLFSTAICKPGTTTSETLAISTKDIYFNLNKS